MARGARKKPKLTRQTILDAAMKIADSKGQDALSMRQLGKALGVEAMSLYHYFRSRDDIIDGIVEHVINEITSAAYKGIRPDDTWQQKARAYITAYRTVGNRHPDAFKLMIQRPLRTASARKAGQVIVDAFLSSGIDDQQAIIAYRTMTTFVAGFVALEVSRLQPSFTTGNFDLEFEKGLDIIIQGIETCLIEAGT
ncbi:transcriptional regulator, TetR family [Vannielia litorea]|uniref:Transcriptional regulator, TetR family n=1 Tax=Vannielia litorea TaxID=1217970 RepID=A0A1N6GTY3_9RHOB|nr:transcriptional regulator, TetR family [Vannielia litorea]